MDTPGSSKLDTPEVRAFYEERFGERYVAIPDTPFVVDDLGRAAAKFNRAERRAAKHRPVQFYARRFGMNPPKEKR
jgi:hypothetical protein